jgi:glycosyltransferase involved in cell wall biosynthesis
MMTHAVLPLRLIHVTTVPMTLRFLRGQAGFMAARGLQSGAVSAPDAELESFGQEERVPVWSLPMERRITPFRDLLALARLVHLLRRIRPHVLHSHTPKGGLLGMLAGALAGVPVRVYHLHGLPLQTARGYRRLLLHLTERTACALADQVLCVSHSLRDAALAAGVVSPTKALVPASGSVNGVDADHTFNPARHAGVRGRVRERYGIPPDASVVGFVGRLVRDKGVVELAAAWRELRSRFPKTHLLLVGPLESEDSVPVDVVRELQADPRVHLLGLEWDVAPLFAAMDVLALPTHREGLGMVLLEAAAMGLPVVASRTTGCVDAVVDGVTGTLMPVGDADALARALERYLSSPELGRAHGEAARQRVLHEFRQEVVWNALADVYRDLLARKGLVPAPTVPATSQGGEMTA